MGEKEDLIEKHDTLFTHPLNLFLNSPYNNTFIERKLDEVWATPKDQYSEVYSFIRLGNVGLLKTSEGKIMCEMGAYDAAGAQFANGLLTPPVLPLQTFKTK